MRRFLLNPLLMGLSSWLRPSREPARAAPPPADLRVAELRIYPIKSCGGISLASSRMAATGLSWDRTFAVVDGAGKIQTQRLKRRLATVRPELDTSAGVMQIAAEGMEPISVPLDGDARVGCTQGKVEKGGGNPVRDMPVWQYPAYVAEWFTELLAGKPGLKLDGAERPPAASERFNLVRFDGSSGYKRRLVDDVGGENARPEDQVAFPDLYPLLVTSAESLAAVNQKVSGEEIPMERFRPNIVVSGSASAFDEDRWAVITVGEGDRSLKLRCLENDPRCQVPSIDQRTGQRSPNFEPTTTLRKFRSLDNFWGQHGVLGSAGPMFGIYATHGAAPGELRVGDQVRVVERSDAGSLHEYWSRRSSKEA